MPEAYIVQSAREDARRREREHRKRQQRGRDWNPDTAYVYAVYRLDRGILFGNLVGFIHGRLSKRRMNRFRKKAKIPETTVVKFIQLEIAAQTARSA